jgi:hypothetical protein
MTIPAKDLPVLTEPEKDTAKQTSSTQDFRRHRTKLSEDWLQCLLGATL